VTLRRPDELQLDGRSAPETIGSLKQYAIARQHNYYKRQDIVDWFLNISLIASRRYVGKELASEIDSHGPYGANTEDPVADEGAVRARRNFIEAKDGTETCDFTLWRNGR
jgi:hypothetical protein